MHLQWVKGNAKLAITGAERGCLIVGWGLPAVATCPGAGACRGVCYATQGSYTWSAVREARERAYEQSKRHDFLWLLKADLQDWVTKAERKGRKLVVRVHDSGDFYSREYAHAWFQAARATPQATFYAYTKSLHLLQGLDVPENFRLIQSQGGLYDDRIDTSKPHARIFPTHADRERAGYVDGSESDWPAIDGDIRIGLVYHGTRKLTDAQARYLLAA